MNDIRELLKPGELFKLSVEDRIQIMGDLWDSITSEPDQLPPLTKEQCAEIDRRIAEHEKDPSTALDWNTVHARLWSLVK
jgi:putative addiction module component (TIGR02574 family)